MEKLEKRYSRERKKQISLNNTSNQIPKSTKVSQNKEKTQKLPMDRVIYVQGKTKRISNEGMNNHPKNHNETMNNYLEGVENRSDS